MVKLGDFGAQLATGHARPNMGAGNSHLAQMVLEGQMGHQTVPPITQIHPYSPNLGFNGLTNSLAVAAQNGTAEIGRGCLN